jgi:hypothetical protein
MSGNDVGQVQTYAVQRTSARGMTMRRRQFIAGLGSAAAWPEAERRNAVWFASGELETPLRPTTGPWGAHMRQVALYTRVSTDRQTTENQELRAIAAQAGWNERAPLNERASAAALFFHSRGERMTCFQNSGSPAGDGGGM